MGGPEMARSICWGPRRPPNPHTLGSAPGDPGRSSKSRGAPRYPAMTLRRDPEGDRAAHEVAIGGEHAPLQAIVAGGQPGRGGLQPVQGAIGQRTERASLTANMDQDQA